MRYICCCLFVIFLSFVALGQTRQLGDTLKVSFLGPDKYTYDPIRLLAVIVYENIAYMNG